MDLAFGIRNFRRVAGIGAGIGVMALAAAGGSALAGPHEHGVAKLDIGVEAARISLLLDTPLDNVAGFERAPRNDAERKAVEAVLAKLRAPEGLVRIDPAAQCSGGKAELKAPVLGLGAPLAEAKGGHADLEAAIDFTCAQGARAGFIELEGLFAAMPRLKRVDVQVATPKGQMKAVLRKANPRITLAR